MLDLQQQRARVTRSARRVAVALACAAPLLPIATAYALVRASDAELLAKLGLPPEIGLTDGRRLALFVLGLAPVCATAWALFALHRASRRISGGVLFDAGVARQLRTAASAMIAAALLAIAVPTAAALVATLGTGRAVIVLQLAAGPVMALVLGLALRFTAAVVVAAQAVSDENAGFV